MLSFPLVVQELFVFIDNIGTSSDSEAAKILYFYPQGKSINDQLTAVGLCEALLTFSRFFSASNINTLHTKNCRRYFHKIAAHVWAVMTVGPANPMVEKMDTCEHFVNDNLLGKVITRLCERFHLLYGSISGGGGDDDMNAIRKNLSEFFQTELRMLELTRRDLLDWFDGVRYLNMDTDQCLQVEEFSRRVKYACPVVSHVAFLYDAKLAWSSISPDVMRVIYQYLIAKIASLPPDLDLDVISSNSKHMGRFLTAPDDLEGLCPGQVPVPIIHHPSQPNTQFHLVVYRALRATVCVLVENTHILSPDFFHTLDSNFGVDLTELSVVLESSSKSRSTSESNSLPSPHQSQETPISTTNSLLPSSTVSQPTPSTRSSSAAAAVAIGGGSSMVSGCHQPQQVNRGIVSWDSEIGSVQSNIHVVHSGGRSHITASALILFAILSAAKNDIVARVKNGNFETMLKVEPDTWIICRRERNREVYMIFSGKKTDLTRVVEESRKLWSFHFSSLINSG